MFMSLDLLMGMAVGRFILAMDMGVRMGVGMFMGVHQLPMAVLMAVDMGMLMRMLQHNGVLYHQDRGGGHDGKAEIELEARPLSQQDHAERHPKNGAME